MRRGGLRLQPPLVSRFVIRCFLCDVCSGVCFLLRRNHRCIIMSPLLPRSTGQILINTNPALNVIPLARSQLLFSFAWTIFDPHNMVPASRNEMLGRVTPRPHPKFIILVYMLCQPVAKRLCGRTNVVGIAVLRYDGVDFRVSVVWHCIVLYCIV
jgi:hypothetical protein